MALSRRGFVRSLGLGTAGLLSAPLIIARGREAAAFEPLGLPPRDPADVIWINSNENARGPGPAAMRTLHETISPRAGRGYPPDHTADLVDAIAEVHGVDRSHVVVGTGSGPILSAAVHAFCSPERAFVTAAPTYSAPDGDARRIGAPVTQVRVDDSGALDLEAMADAAVGAGLVFFCNPNNPTGTAYPAGVVEEWVRQVKQRSPGTAILIDEAYMDYAFDPQVTTATPLTRELPGVFITRTLSKAHGMAGLRVGYAVGQPETVRAIATAWHLGSMNMLSAAAAIASLRDVRHLDAERAENARIRDFTLRALRELGCDAPETHANFVFVDVGRPLGAFRTACQERGVRIGRDFPPFNETHARISLGTWEEMERAVGVFRDVLAS
jgi:histidinol-phosphate aminotransferase